MTTSLSPASTALRARPRLRDDVVWLESDQGVYVRSAHAAMMMRGAGAYRLMTTVSQYLTGEHSLAELCDGLPEGQARAVTSLVGALLERGMARDFQGETGVTLPEPVAERFAAQVAFLGHFTDEPVTRFLSFRTARVLLLGAGHALDAAATGLLRNGLGRLHLPPAAGGDAHRDGIAATARTLGADIATGDAVVGFDLVLYCADEPDLAQVADLARRCLAAGVAFLPAVLREERAVLGPLWRPGTTGCWMCAQLRLTANDPAGLAARLWQDVALGRGPGGESGGTEAVARMIGNAAAFDAFRELTGALEPDTAGAVLVQDPVTLEAGLAPLLAHPRCTLCGEQRRPAPEPPSGLTDEDRYRRLSRLVDQHTGVFARFTDDELRQSPLPTARLRIGPADAGRQLSAFDVETVLQARLAVLRTALGWYADRLAVAPVVRAHAADLDAPAVAPGALDTWAGLTAPEAALPGAWLAATSLLTGERRYVPAAAVFPHGAANRERIFETTPAGLAVGTDAEDVTFAGLRGALAYRALDALVRGTARVTELDPDRLTGQRLEFLRDCLGHLGHRPVLRLVDAGAPVSVVLAGLDGPGDPGWRVGFAAGRADAVEHALRDLLGAAQLAAYHGEPADLGDPLLAGLPDRIAAAGEPAPEGAPATRADLLDHLAGTEGDALYVPTTPDDVAEVGGYQTGRILLLHR
ncbi:TOMM precursor leader peptide-binding protein [Dactylosporangium sp. CA-092794]|uniref:TOMM precursor leader peptide-binding protein n=1 Tax=Dactylosporangium sp. CA-092794 TaxID=3239929 RepID=UPI003D8BC2F4